jgi:hypothetical protein
VIARINAVMSAPALIRAMYALGREQARQRQGGAGYARRARGEEERQGNIVEAATVKHCTTVNPTR